MKIEELYELYTKHFLVDTDTRNIRKNSLFFALKGDNFNGNIFAEDALNLGANFAIVDEAKYKTKANIILVDDVLKTLQKLANYHRKQLSIPVIGLTGSNGKTTTKELFKVVLEQQYKTIATQGNLNNHIGVPLTVLSIRPEHEIAIIEMGANHQKEIAFLSSICEPDYGYITNYGKAHLEGFGGVEGVIKGKSELYDNLRQHNKTAIVNPNDPIQLEKSKGIKTIYLEVENIQFKEVNPFVKLTYLDLVIQTNLIGSYNFTNIAAAITLGDYFKVDKQKIKKAIESYVPKNNRSQIIQADSNTIILDAYNANPSSMKVALENFALLESNQKVIILGDMFELGEESKTEHQAIALLADSLNFTHQFLVGEHFYKTDTSATRFSNYQDLENHLKNNNLKDAHILVKGSRGMRLERVLDVIS